MLHIRQPEPDPMIRVLLVDDSITQREILRRLLNDDGKFVVVAEARNGREAVDLAAELTPDIVLMDIHMPELNGVEATREIMRRCPVPIVLASAALKQKEIDLGLEGLKAGAVSVIEKPEGAVLLHLDKIAPRLQAELAAASKAQLWPRRVIRRRESENADTWRDSLEGVEVIGMCASTGGPPVLLSILKRLPKPYPLPVLLVQHIGENFVSGFARWLSEASGQSVRVLNARQRLQPGVWLSPGGSHLAMGSRTWIELLPAEPSEIHCPSGNVLFESMARHAGAKAVGILLTGMGDDGARGLIAVCQAGGRTLIQDEASSLIWGMPKAARDCGAAHHELNPEAMADALIHAVRSRPRSLASG
jgi:two-component system, chemotaxis family, protein-glutamate methylesterase/glutaminase